MGLLRVSVDHLVRISATSARVHARVHGSSLVATGVAGRKAAEVRDVVAALAARGISEDAVEVTGIRLTTSDGRILHSQSVDIQLVIAAGAEQLPDVLGVLADRPGVAVEQLEWVYDEFEASITAAAEAMTKARRKADAIAAAAGLEVTGIAERERLLEHAATAGGVGRFLDALRRAGELGAPRPRGGNQRNHRAVHASQRGFRVVTLGWGPCIASRR